MEKFRELKPILETIAIFVTIVESPLGLGVAIAFILLLLLYPPAEENEDI